MKFRAKIVEGHITFSDKYRWTEYLRQIEGKYVDIEVKIYRKKRTLDQNAYWWGVVMQTLSENTGYEKEEMNDLIESMFLSKELEIEGVVYTVPGKVKNLSTVEFNELKERVQRWAAIDLGIDIPDPEQIIY